MKNKYSNKIIKLFEMSKKYGFNIPQSFVIEKEEFNKISFKDFQYQKIAIRSAAIGEDGKQNSFAGIFKSKLNVTKNDFEKSLKEVINSFYSKKSKIYQQLKKTKIIPQILIQRMIKSEKSIVIFIEKEKITISITTEECEKIVSGKNNTKTIEIKNHIKSIKEKIKDEKLFKFIEKILITEEVIKIKENELIDIEATFEKESNKWFLLQYRKILI